MITPAPKVIAVGHKHILDDILDVGRLTCPPSAEGGGVEVGRPPKIPLHACVSVNDLSDVDVINDSFYARVSLFLVWEWKDVPYTLDHLPKRARAAGAYTHIPSEDVEELKRKCKLPNITPFNAIKVEDLDEGSYRVYDGGKGETYLMFSKSWAGTFRQRFHLSAFPVDSHSLTIALFNSNPQTWDDFDLSIFSVQFHRDALELSEWAVLQPRVERVPPTHKRGHVLIMVQRLQWYYLRNIVSFVYLFALLSPLVFLMDIKDTGIRIANVLTLLLTIVAFKFTIASVLPKVTYNTLIDDYISRATVTVAVVAFLGVVPSFFSSEENAVTANKIIGGFVAVIITGQLVVWLFFSFRIASRRHSAPIHASEGKNWCVFKFYTPTFLQPAPVELLV